MFSIFTIQQYKNLLNLQFGQYNLLVYKNIFYLLIVFVYNFICFYTLQAIRETYLLNKQVNTLSQSIRSSKVSSSCSIIIVPTKCVHRFRRSYKCERACYCNSGFNIFKTGHYLPCSEHISILNTLTIHIRLVKNNKCLVHHTHTYIYMGIQIDDKF